jgi:hypothetical protein
MRVLRKGGTKRQAMESSSIVSVRNARRTGRPQGFLPPFRFGQGAEYPAISV